MAQFMSVFLVGLTHSGVNECRGNGFYMRPTFQTHFGSPSSSSLEREIMKVLFNDGH